MVSNYLASFRPLRATAHGRQAVQDHGLPPFIDGSCRREPDLEHDWPSISGLCRGGNFAPRLQVGDHVAFVTIKGRYDRGAPPCWKLVAVLRVAQRFVTHKEAAAWYSDKGLRLPSNCMVPGNDPVPLERTLGPSGHQGCSGPEIIKEWDGIYQQRAKEWPVMLACEKLMVELYDPVRIEEADWMRWIGKVPGTQNPPMIDNGLLDHLQAKACRKAA